MPVRYNLKGSGGESPKQEPRYSATHNAMYEQTNSKVPTQNNRGSGSTNQHQSQLNNNPKTFERVESQDEYDKFRFGGGDAEDSYQAPAPKPTYKSSDFVPPTRVSERRTSATPYDPLQFIKGARDKNPLVENAKKTIEVMETQKKVKASAVETEHEEWQSNLSTWKARMRRKSSGAHLRAQESEELAAVEEEQNKRSLKTFREMQEEREQRRTTRLTKLASYPIDDEDDIFSTKPSSSQGQSSLSASGSSKAENGGSSLRSRSTDSSGRSEDGSSPRISGSKSMDSSEEKLERVAPVRAKDGHKMWSWRHDAPEARDSCNLQERKKSVEAEDEPVAAKEEIAPWARSPMPGEDDAPKELSPEQERNNGMASSYSDEIIEVPNLGVTRSYRRLDKVETPPSRRDLEYSSQKLDYTDRGRSHMIEADGRRKPVIEAEVKRKETSFVHSNPLRQREVKSREVEQESQMDSSNKRSIEKIIKIKQRPNDTKGFGFTISGGKEYSAPITVEKVTLGSSADVCELHKGDEVVSINGASVGSHYHDSVILVINQAVRSGHIELRIRRTLPTDHEELEDSFEHEARAQQQRDSEAANDTFEEEQKIMERLEQEELLEAEKIRQQEAEREHQEHQREQQRKRDEEERKRELQLQEEERLRAEKQRKEDQQRRELEEKKQSEMMFQQQQQETRAAADDDDVDDDVPPPLPSSAPPPPNWSTFPGSGPPSAPHDSFLDDSAVVLEEQDDAPKTRQDMLRRKSEFLGLKESEEFKALQEGKERDSKYKEESEWYKIEKKEVMMSKPKLAEPALWQQVETPTKTPVSTEYKQFGDGSQNIRAEFDLEQREREIIENLEREEREKEETMRQWKSMEQLKTMQPVEIELERASRDMETLLASQPRPAPLQSSHRFFDQDAERRRMEDWGKEQDRKLKDNDVSQAAKERFAAEQEELQRKRAEDLRKAEEAEKNKRKQEEALLEKERIWQAEMETKKRAWEEEKRRREAEEEQRQAEEDRQRKEDERRRREEKLKDMHRPSQQAYSYALDTEYSKREEERSLKSKEQRRLQEEQERILQEQEEQARQEQEEQQRRQEEMEAAALAQKEQELRQMEVSLERIRREQQELRQERERLRREKEEQQRNLYGAAATTTTATAAGVGLLTTDQVQRNHVAPPHSPPAEYVYNKPLNQPLTVDTQQQSYSPPQAVAPHHGYRERSNSGGGAGGRPHSDDYSGVTSLEILRHAQPAPVRSSHSPSLSPAAAGGGHSQTVAPITKKPLLLKKEPLTIPSKPREVSPRAPVVPPILTREEVLRMNRTAGFNKSDATWQSVDDRTTTSPRGTTPPRGVSPTTTTHHDPSAKRHSLHNISQVPKPKLAGNESWIMTAEEKQRKEGSRSRMSEVMRQNMGGDTSKHWVVEEAERRRKAEQSGKERLQKLQSRQQQGYGPYSPPGQQQQNYQNGGYNSTVKENSPPAFEHEEPPYNSSPPQRPIPDTIKQTLMERVSSPRSPTGAPVSSHYAYPHQALQPAYSSSSSQFTAPFYTPSNRESTFPTNSNLSPSKSHSTYNPSLSSSQTNLYQQSSSHGQHSSFQQQNQNSYHYSSVNAAYSFSNTNNSSAAYHIRTGSDSSDRAPPPPVPPKPPRLLSTSSEESRAEQVTVSGYQQCAHCEQELGQGAAMIVESLGLYYHVECFRCCVCHAPLGTGEKGADVRVRVNKLHCHNCYSNDEVGLKYSRV